MENKNHKYGTFTETVKKKFKISNSFYKDYIDLMCYYATFPIDEKADFNFKDLSIEVESAFLRFEHSVLHVCMEMFGSEGYVFSLTNDMLSVYEDTDSMIKKVAFRWEKDEMGYWSLKRSPDTANYHDRLFDVEVLTVDTAFLLSAALIFTYKYQSGLHDVIDDLARYRKLKEERDIKRETKPETPVVDDDDNIAHYTEQQAIENTKKISMFKLDLNSVARFIAGGRPIPPNLETLKDQVYHFESEGSFGETVEMEYNGDTFYVEIDYGNGAEKAFEIGEVQLKPDKVKTVKKKGSAKKARLAEIKKRLKKNQKGKGKLIK